MSNELLKTFHILVMIFENFYLPKCENKQRKQSRKVTKKSKPDLSKKVPNHHQQDQNQTKTQRKTPNN